MSQFNVYVKDSGGQPIVDARVCILTDQLSGKTRHTDGGGFANFFSGPPIQPVTFDVIVDAAGYKPYATDANQGTSITFGPVDVTLNVTLSFKRPVVVPRPPLPAFPPGQYDRVLPWTPPQDPNFLRADAWGVTIPGLPFVPGGSSKHPERCLSWFLDRWEPNWQQKILTKHAQNAYTHFILSAPDSIQGNGRNLAQFVQTCQLVKSFGFRVVVFLGSKVYQPQDQSSLQWIQYFDPLLDALLPVADEFLPGWEWNLFNIPGQPTIDAFRHVGQRAHSAGKTCWLHFSSEVTSWYQNGDPRGRYGFYDDLSSTIDGLMYQTDPNWDVPNIQARLVDTLTQFGNQPYGHKLRAYEEVASLEFDGDRPDEDDANVRGFLSCCTNGLSRVWGFGNGARMPDGTPL